MPRKKEPEQLDEWGNPIQDTPESSGKKLTSAERFELDTKEDPWEVIDCPRTQKRRRSGRIVIPMAGAAFAVLLVTILLFQGGRSPLPFLREDGEAVKYSPNPISDAGDISKEDPKTSTPTPEKKLTPTLTPVKKTPTPTPIPKTPTPAPTLEPNPMAAADQWYDADLRYYYQQLSDHEKKLYATIYQGISEFKRSIDIQSGRYMQQELDRVHWVMGMDAPELIHYAGTWTTWTLGSSITKVDPDYRLTESEYKTRAAKIREVIADVRRSAPTGQDDFRKEYAAYRYLIEHCVYEIAADEDKTSNADSALCSGKAQCAGYARGLSLLLRSLGIPCIQLSSKSLDHEWNLVRVNGEWYICDVTWDDDTADGYQRSFPEGQNAFLFYLNLPQRLAEKHVPDREHGFSLPSCTSLKDNYVVREGIYIAPGTSGIPAKLASELEEAYSKGKRQYIIMIDDRNAYSNRMNMLKGFTDKHLTWVWPREDAESCSVFVELR